MQRGQKKMIVIEWKINNSSFEGTLKMESEPLLSIGQRVAEEVHKRIGHSFTDLNLNYKGDDKYILYMESNTVIQPIQPTNLLAKLSEETYSPADMFEYPYTNVMLITPVDDYFNIHRLPMRSVKTTVKLVCTYPNYYVFKLLRRKRLDTSTRVSRFCFAMRKPNKNDQLPLVHYAEPHPYCEHNLINGWFKELDDCFSPEGIYNQSYTSTWQTIKLNECTVCLTNKENTLSHNCVGGDHFVACEECIVDLIRRKSTCPICREVIRDYSSIVELQVNPDEKTKNQREKEEEECEKARDIIYIEDSEDEAKDEYKTRKDEDEEERVVTSQSHKRQRINK